jgi:hypothetical protein
MPTAKPPEFCRGAVELAGQREKPIAGHEGQFKDRVPARWAGTRCRHFPCVPEGRSGRPGGSADRLPAGVSPVSHAEPLSGRESGDSAPARPASRKGWPYGVGASCRYIDNDYRDVVPAAMVQTQGNELIGCVG